MISKKLLSVAIFSFSLFIAGESKAAFPVKKTAPVEVVNSPVETSALTSDNVSLTSSAAEAPHVVVKKHSFLNRVATKLAKKAAVSQAAYIILSIFWLGWLAIGLNDDFDGSSWLIALLLYILFYFPGLIYSLIVMGDYY